ncbi:hypothetical protein GCM10027429_33200 [Marivirga atlantica]|uniref:Uncharacterized protein n=2 Tax=Marivirga atlantica TaxID=1548457 RepID=A0A937AAL2_9BACT|nr:hypothetical protein [Marivirga atlantica]
MMDIKVKANQLKISSFAIYLLFSISVKCQEISSPLNLDKNYIQETYTLNGKVIRERQVMKLMVMNPEALALIKSSRKKEFLADIVAGIGFSGMVGSVVYLFSEGGLTGIYPAIGSTAIFLGGVAIMKRAIKDAKDGVDLYNIQQSSTSRNNRSNYMALSFQGGGLSLIYCF